MLPAISWLIHGASKCGKSTVADTQPAPRLHLDAEGGMGTRFLKSAKMVWDPMREAPPDADGSWDTCVVHVRDYETVKRVYQWLDSGQHQFRSVTLDSISEIQQRAVDSLVGTDQMKTQDWGQLLREVSAMIRRFRDLTNHPTNPLMSVLMVAMTTQVGDPPKWKPYVQGQLAARLPYYVDVCGYMFVERDDEGAEHRKLLVSQHPEYEAGERVGGVLGQVIEDPDIADMIEIVFGPLPVIGQPA